jgi:hypothetical protein
MVVDNAGAGKLDYYLRRSVNYDLGACSQGMRASTITVTLRSDVPDEHLPAYVLGKSQRLLVYLYLSLGASPTSVSVDGHPSGVFIGRELRRPVVELPVDLPPHVTRTITVRLTEPAAGNAVTVRVQPLATPQTTQISRQAC